jgi:hypothetical protein
MARSPDGQITPSQENLPLLARIFSQARRVVRMIRFDCDWCRRTKASDEIWILGLAAEAIGVTAARREITILPIWTRDRAVHPLAVHFCCEECKDDYMAQLFNDKPALATDVVVETATTRKSPRKSRRTVSSKARHRSRRKQAA